MKFQTAILLVAVFVAKVAGAASLYDCSSPRPEMAGFHNMILFGKPDDRLYAYHLPLFAGAVNGSSGHVLMHVYQGVWQVELDQATKAAYDLKFSKERTAANPFPFFSIAPQGKRFKVPEMFCEPQFSLSATAVYGHVESNPDFPAPERLVGQLSQVTAKDVVLARRFDGSSKPALTYYLFGTSKQHYMVHFLTDDENSFDQIVAVEVLDRNLAALIGTSGGILVTVPKSSENQLVAVTANVGQLSPNNKWKLPLQPLGKKLSVVDAESGVSGMIQITGEVYFNSDNDLKRK